MYRFKTALATAIVGSLVMGCAHHLTLKAQSSVIPNGSTVGVLVEVPWGQSSRNDLALFMSAALMKRGLRVKSINPSDLIPEVVWQRISSNEDRKYSLLEAIAVAAEGGGKIRGNKELFERLININEIKDANLRFRDLNQLVDEFVKRWNTDYIMFVIPALVQVGKGVGIDPKRCMVKVIRIDDKETIFVYYLDTHKGNFDRRIPDPGIEFNMQARQMDAFKIIKLCEYLADELTRAKPSDTKKGGAK